MGNWVMHIDGHGVHDNGLDRDAEERLRQFVEQLLADGHQVNHATICVGAVRKVVAGDGETPTYYAYQP